MTLQSSWKISIHAPTRGATGSEALKDALMNISIHAPTRGATAIALVFMWWGVNFNPRSYKRSDVGAVLWLLQMKLFQSTLLQEERQLFAKHCVRVYHFNPRSYKRSDGLVRALTCGLRDFNPRSYKRSDLWHSSYICMYPIISIHAPTRGATVSKSTLSKTVKISIHAPTRGATLLCSSPHLSNDYFNPRSYKRSDFGYTHYNNYYLSFQSTLLQEERQMVTPVLFI